MPINHTYRATRFWAALCLVLLSFPAPSRCQQPEPLRLSLVQLITNPERYDGKLVSVVGYLSFGSEGDGLYLHKEDYDNGINADGLTVDRTKQMLKDREKLYDNYVLIVGMFRRQALPAIYVSTGRITDVKRCELWSQPDHPRVERLKLLQSQEAKP